MTTEDKILQAAEKEFITKGYDGARTTSIAAAAGVTHAMLHYYFRTKDNLFDRVIESKIGTLRDIMLMTIDMTDAPLLERIRQTIERHIDFIAANPGLPKFMLNEVMSRSERLQALKETVLQQTEPKIRMLQQEIDENAEKGICRKADARMLLLDIVSLNIFPYMASPLVNSLLGGIIEDKEAFTEKRKKENVETIMRKLIP